MFPQLVGADNKGLLVELEKRFQLETISQEGMIKIISAPKPWHSPYLGLMVSDYLAYQAGQSAVLNLSWVLDFIREISPSEILKIRSLTEVEEFFGGAG